MNKKTFITEEHLKRRKIFRILGPIVLGFGILCIVIALVDFLTLDMFEEPKYFGLFFLGIPLTAVGFTLSSLGYGSEIAKYQTREMAPVVKDTFNYLAEETKDGVETIARAVQKGTSSVVEAKQCHYCNELNKIDAKFCNECGRSL